MTSASDGTGPCADSSTTPCLRMKARAWREVIAMICFRRLHPITRHTVGDRRPVLPIRCWRAGLHAKSALHYCGRHSRHRRRLCAAMGRASRRHDRGYRCVRQRQRRADDVRSHSDLTHGGHTGRSHRRDWPVRSREGAGRSAENRWDRQIPRSWSRRLPCAFAGGKRAGGLPAVWRDHGR